MKTYTTVQGDKWDSIAFRLMGSTDYTDRLIGANLKYRNIYLFPAGIILEIPEVDGRTYGNLPPWKRVGG